MKKHNYPGLFVAFEGLDGSGSSTQVDLLKDRLRKDGIKAFDTKEPTNNIIGGIIRGALTREIAFSPEGLQLLYAADRSHHLKREIIPALEAGHTIITDRYHFSTIAFGSLKLDYNWLVELSKYFILPDITFFIEVSPKECLRRINKSRLNKEFFEEEEKLKSVLKYYKKLVNDKKFGIFRVDGEREPQVIHEEIYKIFHDKCRQYH